TVAGQSLENDDDFSAAISAPEISVLALNATGETRYLGPSSGIPFTGYAAAITRRLVSSRVSEHVRTTSENMTQSQISFALTDQDRVFDGGEAEGLVESYLRWIQPLYPLFEAETLKATVRTCQELEAANEHGHDHSPEHALKMAEYYLILALGAIHDGNINEQVVRRTQPRDSLCRSNPKRDPVRLYLKSLEYFELGSSNLQSSTFLIRVILLMCIYGSHGKASLGQWQLAGLAVRMAVELGLHQSNNSVHITDTEADARNRVFWTAYIIEILLAYNLGRPPSIGEEHITAKLPVTPSTMPISIHHIRHRQIQGRIVASVYGAAQKQQGSSEEHRHAVLSKLQAELDEWRGSLRGAFQSSSGSGYSYWERLYNGTSFVLYRSSPLCPKPAAPALEKCIRSAAAYVDNMTDVIRSSRISLSWMLIQGVLFAGLTMLVTARNNFEKLLPTTGLQFFLADFPAWARKCAICLAIMNERWNEDLLVTLESRFEALVNDTLKFISTNVTASLATMNSAADTSRFNHPQDPESTTHQDLDGLQDQIWPFDDEIMFEDALARAHEQDSYYQKHGKTMGPFHGIVMTLKDQFDVKGVDSTLGYCGRAFQPAQENALLVNILQDFGAIFIAKTNLPQSIMWCETEIPLWGVITNPTNPDLTPGGSTGGESAVLSQMGSLVGWGTDLGGSIRIPSHMMGLYGLKPSHGRLPYDRVSVSTEGQGHVPSVVGPLARSLSSLKYVTQAVIEAQTWSTDPQIVPIPWRPDIFDEVQQRPLVVGLLVDDGTVRAHPPIIRVLQEVANKLRAAGHEIVQWNSDHHADCIEIMDLYYTADGGEDIQRDVSAAGEPYIPHVDALIKRGSAISVYDYWQLNRRKLAMQKACLAKWKNVKSPTTDKKVDILITPTMPHVSVPHRSCKWVGYTKIWNFLDSTALVLPAGQVDKSIDKPLGDEEVCAYVPRNDMDRWKWALYDPVKMHGMPVSVQIVGHRLEEEKVLGAAHVIERVLKTP
ncbi:acetamidase, partial [Aureobasidium melanogenum]